MAALQSHLEKVRDTPPPATTESKETEKDEGTGQGNKRKRGVHPAVESLEKVEQAAKQRSEMEEAIVQITKQVSCHIIKE